MADLMQNMRFLDDGDFFGYWPCEFLFQELRLFGGTPLRDVYEKRLDTQFAAHEVPQTPFFDAGVRTAWECATWYRRHYHATVNRLIRRLADSLDRLTYSTPAAMSNVRISAACQRGQVVLVRLKHLAYQFMERLLTFEEELREERPIQEIVSRLDLSMFDACIQEATDALADILHEARAHGLEAVATDWNAIAALAD